ncbi:MAG: hypothetical protein AB7H90_23430 [Alphaproteobacteria bacterium]
MANGILIAAMDFSACPEDEFHDWYDLEHVPERLRIPGFLNAERWIDIGNPKISVATYDLETVAVLHSPPYLAIAGANSSPWTKRTQRFRKSLMRYEGEQILPGDATAPAGAGGLLLVGMTPAGEVETAFNAWYDTEHIPALARVPGVLRARRYRTGTGNPKYVALYHLASPGVVDTPEWQQASGSTPMPQPVREKISNRLRHVCRPYART